jgi:hypothetical protein
MIKIDKTIAELDALAHKHFEALCDKPFNLDAKIEEEISLSNNKFEKSFYRFLQKNLKDVIVAHPSELQQLSTPIGREFARWESNCRPKGRAARRVKSIFNYSAFVSPKIKWGAYDLVKELDVRVCPYCNRQYTTTIVTKKGRTRPQLDHFFSKSGYPYFALSFYNLVPSCAVCNASLKRSIEFTYEKNMHPFVDDGNDWFQFMYHQVGGGSIPKKEEEIKIVLARKKKVDDKAYGRIRSNFRVFKIKEIYNLHKDVAIEIILKRQIYTDTQIQELLAIKNAGDPLFGSREDLLRVILGNYVEPQKLARRPLAKFMVDIAQQVHLV